MNGLLSLALIVRMGSAVNDGFFSSFLLENLVVNHGSDPG